MVNLSQNRFASLTIANSGVAAVPEAYLDGLATIIEQRTLMQFGKERRDLLVSTLASLAAAEKQDAAAYAKKLLAANDEKAMMGLVDALTINETTFFRNVPQLNLFATIVLPEIIARKRASSEAKTLQVWSAGCSTGQEAYTLAILANEAVRPLFTWGVQILATDISPTVLATARTGVYPKSRLDTMPAPLLARYFDDLGDQIRVKDTLRNLVTFKQHNLSETFPPLRFDVIFCRNVMIYFSRQEQARLAQRFTERLAPEGFLFIGHSESLQGTGIRLELRMHNGGVVYQKI